MLNRVGFLSLGLRILMSSIKLSILNLCESGGFRYPRTTGLYTTATHQRYALTLVIICCIGWDPYCFLQSLVIIIFPCWPCLKWSYFPALTHQGLRLFILQVFQAQCQVSVLDTEKESAVYIPHYDTWQIYRITLGLSAWHPTSVPLFFQLAAM